MGEGEGEHRNVYIPSELALLKLSKQDLPVSVSRRSNTQELWVTLISR